MTDWERVDKLRAKGMSWDEIAEDEKVGFSASGSPDTPGRALKTAYFDRRSKRQTSGRGSGGMAGGKAGGKGAGGPPPGPFSRTRIWRTVSFLGILVALAALIPIAISFGFPLITALVPLEVFAGLAIGGAILLGLGFLGGSSRVLIVWKGALIGGVVSGLVLAGVVASITLSAGCPNLTTTKSGEPGPAGDTGWVRVGNPVWTSGGPPVVFFEGSEACPYCSASSWALNGALRNFSTSFTGTFYATSNPNDVYPNTPEVALATSSATGPYISWDPHEGTDTAMITIPYIGCPESAYVSTYNASGGIPFVVIGGIYVHTGTIVDPALLSPNGQAMAPQTVASDLAACQNENTNSVCSAILPAQYWLEAYMVKADTLAGISAPASVTANPTIAGYVDQIS